MNISSKNALARKLEYAIFFAMKKYKEKPQQLTAEEQYSVPQNYSKIEKMKQDINNFCAVIEMLARDVSMGNRPIVGTCIPNVMYVNLHV
jgi:hypothetical protein